MFLVCCRKECSRYVFVGNVSGMFSRERGAAGGGDERVLYQSTLGLRVIKKKKK